MARPSSYRCSECDQLGHNARTCVAAKAAAVESQLALAMWWGSMLTAENARLRSLAGEPLKPGVGGAPYDGSPVVYFLHYDNGATKVGWASDLRRRLRDHHGSAPGGIVLLAAVRAERCVETDYHRRFAAMRDHHEFFRLEQHHIPETDFDVAPLNEERARCGFRKTCPVCGRTFVAAVPIR